jgi:hypothetical protein
MKPVKCRRFAAVVAMVTAIERSVIALTATLALS